MFSQPLKGTNTHPNSHIGKKFANWINGCYLETEYRLFPPVTIFVNLFPRAGYFFNAFDWDKRNSKRLIILDLSGAHSK